MSPAEHIDKARRAHAMGHYLLAGDFAEGAGREAYLAAFHASLAYIAWRTGKQPKTHSGTRSEFSRLAKDDARVDPFFAAFLGLAYEMKTVADYDRLVPVVPEDAKRALADAGRMIEAIADLVTTTGSSNSNG